jgi:23S rRNA (cytidine2498-2'-O)-methyltransferase
MSDRTAYLAAEGYTDELAHELGAVERKHGRLLVATGSPRPAAWAANVWLDPHEIKVTSTWDGMASFDRPKTAIA